MKISDCINLFDDNVKVRIDHSDKEFSRLEVYASYTVAEVKQDEDLKCRSIERLEMPRKDTIKIYLIAE